MTSTPDHTTGADPPPAGGPATGYPPRDHDPAPGSTPAQPCGCPPGATTTAGRVLVTGHQNGCPSAGPRQYVWQLGGRLVRGTLADYGSAFEIEYGIGGLGEELRTWDASYQVSIEWLAATPDADGLQPVRLSLPGESVEVVVFWTAEA